ncbi:hypothetical protein [Bacteroides sedimenti]|uniref:Transmembrane protein n=1 Tax=Bacteroides sedimenti TaxID=2136147 RepID=A0ABN6Z2L5_9BACE
MKKIILSLVAIIMVSMNSVSMASNKGGKHKGNRTEVIIRYENDRDHEYRDRDCREYKDRDDDRYYSNNNRRYDNYDDNEYYERRDRMKRCKMHRYDDQCHDCREHRDNSGAKVAGAILGTAALILLTTAH